jgi:cell division septum initiation protein DivIVA
VAPFFTIEYNVAMDHSVKIQANKLINHLIEQSHLLLAEERDLHSETDRRQSITVEIAERLLEITREHIRLIDQCRAELAILYAQAGKSPSQLPCAL